MLFRFDEFEIDTERFELRRDGQTCHIEPKVYDLIAFLVEHPDAVFSGIN